MVLFWAIGVIPAGVITAIRGQWLLFWCGWLTLGILWFIGALVPDPGAESRDPRWVLAAPVIVGAILVLGVLGARPTPVLGLNGEALQASVGGTTLIDACEPVAAGAWTCQRWDSEASGTISYRVKADWKGCWYAVRRSPDNRSPKRLSGCVTLVSYLS